tara:strand:- start:1051 stop:1206 length:156 start_codon:yes stop_codon:yes gene_type:complete
MSYTTSYIIDLANLELELDFILSNEPPHTIHLNQNYIMELESEIQQRTELF